MADRKIEAASILSQALSDSFIGFSSIHSLRLVATKAAPFTQSAVAEDAATAAQLLINGLHQAFTENAPLMLSVMGGMEGLTEGLADQHRRSYEAVIDAASLIVAHSVLDSAVFECCRGSATADPHDWESLVENKRISLVEMRGRDYECLLDLEVAKFIEKIGRESLLKRVDRLFAICRPETTVTKGYSFSRERLVALDDLRHSVVHGRRAYTRLPSIDDDVSFLRDTSIFIVMMVMKRYGLSFIPQVKAQMMSLGEKESHNRVGGGFSPPPPTPPSMRVRTGRFTEDS